MSSRLGLTRRQHALRTLRKAGISLGDQPRFLVLRIEILKLFADAARMRGSPSRVRRAA